MYDYVIFTHIPVFYKVNLYNEISKKLKIHVIFIADETDEKRSEDFINKNVIRFDYTVLKRGSSLQRRNKLQNIIIIAKLIRAMKYRRVIVSGWELLEFWFLVFFNVKKKNYLALESTINESESKGIRASLKKLFLSRISCVFASGNLHKQLLTALNYKGEVKITKGVGIINKPPIDIIERTYSKKFLYVGRLSEEKNLISLVHIFNQLPNYELTLIGTGLLEQHLKEIAKTNVNFLGAIDNHQLDKFYYENDFLLLASHREPWGLVVEEALYFGMPVIISGKCGASELIQDGKNGFVFNSEEQLIQIIKRQNKVNYPELIEGVSKFSIALKDTLQTEAYC